MELPPSEVDSDHPLVAALAAAAADSGAPALPVGGWSAASDGGYLMRDAGIPTVLFGPGSIVNQAHRADESVPLDSINDLRGQRAGPPDECRGERTRPDCRPDSLRQDSTGASRGPPRS